jgi:hypothetical protein
MPGREHHSFIQAGIINRLPESAERIEPLLAILALVEELPNRSLDQLIGTPIAAASEFLLHLVSQIRWQRDVHDRLLPFILRVRSAMTP